MNLQRMPVHRPALINWEKGKLEVNRNWQRLGMDITHYGANHFLTFTDCGLSHFLIWKQLVRQNLASVIHELEMVFFKHGPPHKLLMDDTAFCSREFSAFTHDWRINLQFRCTYTPRNGIAERCYFTVKHIAARMCCPILEAVYWHNLTPKDNVSPLPITAPTNGIY